MNRQGIDQTAHESSPNGPIVARRTVWTYACMGGWIAHSISQPVNRRAMGKSAAHFPKRPLRLSMNESANEAANAKYMKYNTTHCDTTKYNITHYIITY